MLSGRSATESMPSLLKSAKVALAATKISFKLSADTGISFAAAQQWSKPECQSTPKYSQYALTQNNAIGAVPHADKEKQCSVASLPPKNLTTCVTKLNNLEVQHQ